MVPRYQKAYYLDITDTKGGLLVYIKSDLRSRLLKKFHIQSDFELIPFELNLRKEKWMFICIYRTSSQNKQYFLDELSKIIDHYYSMYGSYITLGDVNMEPSDSLLIHLCNLTTYNLIKSNTYFKVSGSCVDLFLQTKNFILKTHLHLRRF